MNAATRQAAYVVASNTAELTGVTAVCAAKGKIPAVPTNPANPSCLQALEVTCVITRLHARWVQG